MVVIASCWGSVSQSVMLAVNNQMGENFDHCMFQQDNDPKHIKTGFIIKETKKKQPSF